VGRTLVANRWLAGSACGKRNRGRPLNSVVSHHRNAVQKPLLAALIAPPILMLLLAIAYVGVTFPSLHPMAGADSRWLLYSVAPALVIGALVAAVIEGFALPVALSALSKGTMPRSPRSMAAVAIGAVGFIASLTLLVLVSIR